MSPGSDAISRHCNGTTLPEAAFMLVADVVMDAFGMPRRPRRVGQTAAIAKARDAAIALVRQRTGATYGQIGRAFGMSAAAVCKALRRHSGRTVRGDRLLALTVAEVDAILACRLEEEVAAMAARATGRRAPLAMANAHQG